MGSKLLTNFINCNDNLRRLNLAIYDKWKDYYDLNEEEINDSEEVDKLLHYCNLKQLDEIEEAIIREFDLSVAIAEKSLNEEIVERSFNGEIVENSVYNGSKVHMWNNTGLYYVCYATVARTGDVDFIKNLYKSIGINDEDKKLVLKAKSLISIYSDFIENHKN